MLRSEILKYAAIHGVGVVLYVAAVVTAIFYGGTFVSLTIPELVAPMLVLLLFVVSAAVVGMLVFLRPLIWYLDGKKRDAVTLAIATVASIAIIAALLLALSALMAPGGAAPGWSLIIDESGEPREVDIEAAAPTDVVKVGYLTFDTPGLAQDTMYLVYEEPGKPALTAELVMDEMSVCGSQSGATPCMAMSITFSTAFAGKRALVEGNMQGDAILVRKLFIVEGGMEPLVYEPGRRYISWPHAVRLIEECRVEMIMQTHALDVGLTLEDGIVLYAIEPTIDEVFRVHQGTGSRCGQIPVATE